MRVCKVFGTMRLIENIFEKNTKLFFGSLGWFFLSGRLSERLWKRHRLLMYVTGYTLADLSEEALVLAAPASTAASSDGTQSVSVVTCNTFSFWDHSNQWSSQLPAGERALALCISSQSWLAVATSQSLLRLFSVSGIQE